jgi:peptidylprolyl isomerase
MLGAAVLLAGCGSSNSSSPSADSSTASGSPSASASATTTGDQAFSSVSVSGDVGTGATVKFSQAVSGVADASKVLTTGKGATVKSGDSLIMQTVIADGASKKTVASSYQDHQPQVVTLSSQVTPLFLNALSGKKIGSRVAIWAPAAEIFGSSGNAQLGIGASDSVLVLFDIIGKPLDGPTGASHPAPSWAPKMEKTKGVLSGFDFKGTPKPDGTLKQATLREGTGAVVKKGQTIFARYLGEVYGGSKPFDQNFDQPSPASFQIGTGGVIAGWDKTLVGKKIGSEVLLAIPPKDGYGKKGQSQAGIKGTDTLYFVVDILGAA